MAIDLCSETSPRISFSNDLGQTDVIPIEEHNSRSDSSLMDSNSDFDFGISTSFQHESSSADELFSGGIILPTQIRQKVATQKQVHKCEPQLAASLPPLPQPSTATNSKKESLKETMLASSESEEKPPQAKSFWSFKRSSSLNCDNGLKRSLICSLPLLSRSNSTGSVPNPKRSMPSKDNHKQSSHKLPLIPMAKSASSSSSSSSSGSSSSSFYIYSLPQKVPVKKNYAGSYSQGGVRISPVLNVPPPYISKGTASLFGLGSFFCSGKDKKNKK